MLTFDFDSFLYSRTTTIILLCTHYTYNISTIIAKHDGTGKKASQHCHYHIDIKLITNTSVSKTVSGVYFQTSSIFL